MNSQLDYPALPRSTPLYPAPPRSASHRLAQPRFASLRVCPLCCPALLSCYALAGAAVITQIKMTREDTARYGASF